MSNSINSFKTIEQPCGPVIFKEKKSKFFGYAFPLTSAAEVKSLLASLKKEHPTANHFCYAWRLGVHNPSYRANDDGEPKNSAGKPIFGQIQSLDLTNLLVVVVRIFGGTKLGVGGLITAYKTAARMVLEKSKVIQSVLKTTFVIGFEYPQLNDVMRLLKKFEAEIGSKKMEARCHLHFSINSDRAMALESRLKSLPKIQLEMLA